MGWDWDWMDGSLYACLLRASSCVKITLFGWAKNKENHNLDRQNMENSSPDHQEYHSQIWPKTTSAHDIEYFQTFAELISFLNSCPSSFKVAHLYISTVEEKDIDN